MQVLVVFLKREDRVQKFRKVKVVKVCKLNNGEKRMVYKVLEVRRQVFLSFQMNID